MTAHGGRLLPLLLCLALPAPLHSQVTGPGSGAVEGVVFDSTRGAPLAGATVFLWRTERRAVTDADGAFLMEDVPEGTHTLVFLHARLDGLGISPGSREVVVRPGERARVGLAVPSLHTVLAAQCAFEAPAEGAVPGGVPVVGRVTNAATGVPYPGARVRLSWSAEGGVEAGALSLFTDAAGWFRACAVPTGVTLQTVATFLGRSSVPRVLVLEAERAGRLDLALGGDDPASEAGAPPSGAAAVPDEPIPLEPLEVIVEGRSMTERAMGGLLVGRAEVEQVKDRATDAADVLREQHVGGLIVRRDARGACVGFSTGQVRMSGRSGCVPVVVFINGARTADSYQAFTIPAESIDHMVLYRPVEAGNLFGPGSANGVLEIFTRHR